MLAIEEDWWRDLGVTMGGGSCLGLLGGRHGDIRWLHRCYPSMRGAPCPGVSAISRFPGPWTDAGTSTRSAASEQMPETRNALFLLFLWFVSHGLATTPHHPRAMATRFAFATFHATLGFLGDSSIIANVSSLL